eukprot:6360968-Pyramimonas_sp.AAC.1
MCIRDRPRPLPQPVPWRLVSGVGTSRPRVVLKVLGWISLRAAGNPARFNTLGSERFASAYDGS